LLSVGVPDSEKQFASVVLETVAGNVQQEEVLWAAPPEENLDGAYHLGMFAIDNRLHLESADSLVLKDRSQAVDIMHR
jgi:hypothetical protein